MIAGCGSQLRVGMGGAYALDFGAVLSVGAARQVDLPLLADVLPACEAAILIGRDDRSDDQTDDEEGC